uniref:YbaK/EbsC family protein n=1 Tax=Thermofilum pendens TaxID=2269 RepID=A0A7C4FFR2_THEPE
MLGPRELEEVLRREGASFSIVEVPRAATAREASESLGVPLDRVVKTVVLVSESRDVVLAVVRADRRVDQSRLARLLGFKKLRLATEEEVVSSTGYPPGGVPPVGHARRLPVYLDAELLGAGPVYAGGGDERHLLLINPEDIVRLAGAQVIDVPKKA